MTTTPTYQMVLVALSSLHVSREAVIEELTHLALPSPGPASNQGRPGNQCYA